MFSALQISHKRANSESSSSTKSYNHFTPIYDSGDGSIFFLDKHDVDCKSSALQGFHLDRPNNNDKINFQYKCKNVFAVSKKDTYKDTTKWTTIANNEKDSANLLENLAVKCKETYALQRFKLIRNPKDNKQIAYEFRCAKFKGDPAFCSNGQTLPTMAGIEKKTLFLELQTVMTENSQVLTEFKLNTKNTEDGGVNYTYTYKACIFEDVEAKVAELNNDIDVVNAKISNLNTNIMTIGSQQAIINAKIKNYKDLISATDAKINKVTSDKGKAEEDLGKINTTLTNLNAQKVKIEGQINDKNVKIENDKESKKNLNAQVSTKQSGIDMINKDKEGKENQIKALQDQVKDLVEQISKATKAKK